MNNIESSPLFGRFSRLYVHTYEMAPNSAATAARKIWRHRQPNFGPPGKVTAARLRVYPAPAPGYHRWGLERLEGTRAHGERSIARAYNGGLEAEPPAGVQGAESPYGASGGKAP